MKKIVILLLLLSGIVTTSNAQKLSKMSEKARNEKLVKTAKEAIKKYAPDYYKYTSGKYKIELVEKNSSGEKIRAFYIVKFLDYNSDEESFREGHPVGVEIWADSGIVDSVFSGHGLGIIIPEKPLPRGQKAPKLEYKRRSPPKIRADGKYEL